MNILFIGDIVGKPGRYTVETLLPEIITENSIDLIIANGENAAGGNGITRLVANELFNFGVDIITMGNHVWANKDIYSFIEAESRLVRPLNYPPNTPGNGFSLFNYNGRDIAIVNLLGRVFLKDVDCPFRCVDRFLEQMNSKTNIIIVDFHAEATAEKIAMGWYLDGKVSALCGTHTHVQTADELILPNKTAYITDVGMTGPSQSVLGIDRDIAIKKFISALPVRFKLAKGDTSFNAVIIDVDENSGRANSIRRLNSSLPGID